MPRLGGGHIGHAKHHVAFGKSTYGPRARMQRIIELKHADEERKRLNQKSEMFDSVEELFEKKTKKSKTGGK